MKYRVKIVREGESRSERLDAIVDRVSEKFSKELAKILEQDKCHHGFAQTGAGIPVCKHCGIMKKARHK